MLTEIKIGNNQAKKGKGRKKRQEGRTYLGPFPLRYVIAVILVVALSIATEYLLNLPVLQCPNRGVTPISLDHIAAEGFTRTADGWKLDADKGTISLGLDGAYVNRFVYRFQYEHLLNAKAYVCYYNEYGEADSDQDLLIEDRNPKLVTASSLNIGKEVDSIVLSFDRAELGEEGSREEAARTPLVITGLEVVNAPSMNPYRIAFFLSVFGLVAFLWFCRGYLGRHMEAGFAVAALVIGALWILSMPATKVGYDEETHLYRAMGLASVPSGMNVNQSVLSLMIPNLDAWPDNQPGSRMEQRELRDYWNRTGDYRTGENHLDLEIPLNVVPAYVGQALVLKLCKGVHVPWGIMLSLGRIGNLLGYVLIMTLAIRKTPVGKSVLTVIGLLPSSLFLACTYSYDPWVLAWTSLGIAWVLSELLNPEKVLTWKSFGGMMGSLFVGILPKAVYAPLVLLALLLPKTKFKDKRTMWIMRVLVAASLFLLLATFVLPVLLAPAQTGDLRGGETSEVGQMSYILGYFPGYLKVLFANIIPAMPKMLFGREIYSLQGHLADNPYTWLAMALMAYVVLTDTKITSMTALGALQKLWAFVLCGGCALLIWTSMYIAYTVPGRLVIAGVQGRYYLPFLFLLCLIPNSRMIIARIKNMWYHTGVLAISSALLLAGIWQTVIKACCL